MIWLLACAANDVTVLDGERVPFEIGEIRSSLFLELAESEPTTGRGIAVLLMTEAEVNCDQFKLQLGSDYFYSLLSRNSFDDDGNGVLTVFQWWHGEGENAGWSGTYPVFGYTREEDNTLSRGAWVLPFSDETTWITPSGGYANIDGRLGTDVAGTFHTDSLKATYQAEHCGRQAQEYYY